MAESTSLREVCPMLYQPTVPMNPIDPGPLMVFSDGYRLPPSGALLHYIPTSNRRIQAKTKVFPNHPESNEYPPVPK
ncbi:S-transferase [Anopheles sinensis]|uniref:S-transferase n=1 Tax=Anopheles sinensis TaxID=74873 RepID=A0A084W3P3_ANOSI|nr:S-transferase [Anopheles sinensis]